MPPVATGIARRHVRQAAVPLAVAIDVLIGVWSNDIQRAVAIEIFAGIELAVEVLIFRVARIRA